MCVNRTGQSWPWRTCARVGVGSSQRPGRSPHSSYSTRRTAAGAPQNDCIPAPQCVSLSVVCFSRQTRRRTPPPMSDHIAYCARRVEENAMHYHWLPQKTTGPVGHSSVCRHLVAACCRCCCETHRAEQPNKRPTSRDDGGFRYGLCVSWLSCEGEPLALPSAKHEVKQHRPSVRYH